MWVLFRWAVVFIFDRMLGCAEDMYLLASSNTFDFAANLGAFISSRQVSGLQQAATHKLEHIWAFGLAGGLSWHSGLCIELENVALAWLGCVEEFLSTLGCAGTTR